MQGQDKGLVPLQGRALIDWVMDSIEPQADTLMISANRNLTQYTDLLSHRTTSRTDHRHNGGVWPDDADLPQGSGPLAGIVTALRRTHTDWLMVVPCDMPHLPLDLISRLHVQAVQTQTDLVVPATPDSNGDKRYHWVCALIRRELCPHTEASLLSGERKVRQWVQSCRWTSVFFDDEAAFTNMNTLETLHGRA
jgi:molybdopterin-guanine dinucleotide biosynthesis protein A